MVVVAELISAEVVFAVALFADSAGAEYVGKVFAGIALAVGVRAEVVDVSCALGRRAPAE